MISVIIPVFNAEKYLKECVGSVLAQTCQDWEIILVDDGSTDSSGIIADRYAREDSRFKVIHTGNAGQANARNTGISHAAGEYFFFIDADDVVLCRDTFGMMLEIMRQPDVSVAEGLFVYGKKYGFTSKASGKRICFTGAEAVEDMMYQTTLNASICGKLYRRELFDGMHFIGGRFYEDLDMAYRLYSKSDKIVLIKHPVYFYRETEGSFIHTWNKRRLDVLYMTEIMEKFISDNHPGLIRAARDRRLSANFNIFGLASVHGESEIAAKCWDLIKKYRWDSFKNPKVRTKNKAGIMISYLGRPFLYLMSRFVYRKGV